MNDVNGKHALLSGGASGIGLATAQLFVAHGAKVHLLDRDETKLGLALADLGTGASGSVVDVTDQDAVARGVAEAIEAMGAVDVLFANAGIPGPVAPIVDYPAEAFAAVLSVHVLGSFLLLKHALAKMPDGSSVIVNSSTVGLRGVPNSSAYVSAKHALVGLTRSVAKEVASRGIRVNAIHPGPTDTAFQHGIEVAATGLDEDAAQAAFDSMIPLGRHAAPSEIAELVAFLASDASRFITGASVAADGGMSA